MPENVQKQLIDNIGQYLNVPYNITTKPKLELDFTLDMINQTWNG